MNGFNTLGWVTLALGTCSLAPAFWHPISADVFGLATGVRAEISRYLSLMEVAERLNITKSILARYKLPKPDAYAGRARGWNEKTLDAWNDSRLGRSVDGKPRKQKMT